MTKKIIKLSGQDKHYYRFSGSSMDSSILLIVYREGEDRFLELVSDEGSTDSKDFKALAKTIKAENKDEALNIVRLYVEIENGEKSTNSDNNKLINEYVLKMFGKKVFQTIKE